MKEWERGRKSDNMAMAHRTWNQPSCAKQYLQRFLSFHFFVEWKVSIKPGWVMRFNIKWFVVVFTFSSPSSFCPPTILRSRFQQSHTQIETHSHTHAMYSTMLNVYNSTGLRQLLTPTIKYSFSLFFCFVAFLPHTHNWTCFYSLSLWGGRVVATNVIRFTFDAHTSHIENCQ